MFKSEKCIKHVELVRKIPQENSLQFTKMLPLASQEILKASFQRKIVMQLLQTPIKPKSSFFFLLLNIFTLDRVKNRIGKMYL